MFDIKIDFNKSHGSYLFDDKSNKAYLDFFNMYSSLPLGYNHPVFGEQFKSEILSVASIRMANNLFESDLLQSFFRSFSPYTLYPLVHLTCTGALAIESALKCAMDYKIVDNPKVLSITKSFHGVNSWGLATDRFGVTGQRLQNYINNNWENLEIDDLINYLETKNLDDLVAVVIEPIQATSGDIYLDPVKLQKINQLCNSKKICFILDEIQTGFGSTGTMWYYEKINLTPDILVFGKKSQVCGIVAHERYNFTISSPLQKLQVTFDGELIDAIRARYIIKAYEDGNLVAKAQTRCEQFREIIANKVENFRAIGHLVAFDFQDTDTRNNFQRKCLESNFLCNKAGERSIRLRPNLAISENEMDHFSQIFKKVIS